MVTSRHGRRSVATSMAVRKVLGEKLPSLDVHTLEALHGGMATEFERQIVKKLD